MEKRAGEESKMVEPDNLASEKLGIRPALPDQRGHKHKVLMIAPTSFFADYGCHVRIYEETRILEKLGHTVTIVAYRNGDPVPGLDIRRTLPIPWRKDYIVGSSRHMFVFDALLALKTLQILLFERFDVIHAHLHEGALIGVILGEIFGIPVVFDFQGSATEESIDHGFIKRDGFLYKVLRSLESWINHSSPIILPSSANAERILLDKFDCKPEQIQILPDCVNTDVFKPASEFDQNELQTLRQNLGIPNNAKVIVYLGLLTEYQGTGLLLQAMQRIQSVNPDVYLLLMGFPVNVYRPKATELGLEDRVIFTGKVPYAKAPIYLALGNVAVAPKISLTEGAGKLLNYMAMALPTVAFDTPVANEYLGLDGIYAKLGDVEDLADKLLRCLDTVEAEQDPDAALLYKSIGLRLRQRAARHFAWKKAGHQIANIYSQLTGRVPKQAYTNQWALSENGDKQRRSHNV